ncbi:hypothetical protein [Bradyrhizobium sp. HKCCYLS2033]|uniref:hypothetical protein n=1 Tax=Bradyrhizobium sp. HKCCYLS2033 TaxID=3420739 RepID=UPI003EBF0955
MSSNLLQDKYHPVESKSGAAIRVMKLFAEIERAHGTEEARRMFEQWAKKPTKNEIIKLKGWRLIERYDHMSEPNVRALARQVATENAALPEHEQLTPRFRPSVQTIESYLRELLRERRNGMQDGTWDGPGADPFRSL